MIKSINTHKGLSFSIIKKQTNEEKIRSNRVYHEILKDSCGGVMYNIANQDKYDTKELLELWNEMTPVEQGSCDGILTGAIHFLQGR